MAEYVGLAVTSKTAVSCSQTGSGLFWARATLKLGILASAASTSLTLTVKVLPPPSYTPGASVIVTTMVVPAPASVSFNEIVTGGDSLAPAGMTTLPVSLPSTRLAASVMLYETSRPVPSAGATKSLVNANSNE